MVMAYFPWYMYLAMIRIAWKFKVDPEFRTFMIYRTLSTVPMRN